MHTVVSIGYHSAKNVQVLKDFNVFTHYSRCAVNSYRFTTLFGVCDVVVISTSVFQGARRGLRILDMGG